MNTKSNNIQGGGTFSANSKLKTVFSYSFVYIIKELECITVTKKELTYWFVKTWSRKTEMFSGTLKIAKWHELNLACIFLSNFNAISKMKNYQHRSLSK
jgi:hypothetical protein